MKTQIVHKDGIAAEDSEVALVTGAAGAMGGAIARRLGGDGMFVILVDRDADNALAVSQSMGSPSMIIQADLSLPDAPREIMEIVGANPGRCDHIINNAGFNIRQRIPDVDLQSWDLVFAVNLRAPMFLVQGAMPIWRQRPGKSITNIGSRAWLSGAAPAYTASKTGLIGLTRSMAAELGPLGVRANAVIPSYVESGFTRGGTSDAQIHDQQETALAVSKLGRLCQPKDIAGAVSFLSSEDGSFITGETLHVCGGAQMAQSNARRAV